MKKLLLTWGIVAFITITSILSGSPAFTAIPHTINYQGMLTNAEGTPLNGYYTLDIRIYDDATGGTLQWIDSTYIQVVQGLFNVVLGSHMALDLAFDKPYWLEVRVQGEIMPRVQLTSVGYAYRAEVADSAAAGGSGGGWVVNGAVVRVKTGIDTVITGNARITENLDALGDINVNGRITSKVSTGTAPLNLSSGTKCDSLNADMVDGVHSGSFLQIRAEGTVAQGNSATLVIPHYAFWTLQLACGQPYNGGLCFVQGFENDWQIAVTYMQYNGDGTSATGGAEGAESSTTTLVSFGSSPRLYSVTCPGESSGDHNIVLHAAGVELRYRLIY